MKSYLCVAQCVEDGIIFIFVYYPFVEVTRKVNGGCCEP